jgi:hypothetical protein
MLMASPSKGKALNALVKKHPEKHTWVPRK